MMFALPRVLAISPLRMFSNGAKWISRRTALGQAVKQDTRPLLPTTLSLSDVVLYAPHLNTTFEPVQLRQPRQPRQSAQPVAFSLPSAFQVLQQQAARDQAALRHCAAQRLECARDQLINQSNLILPLEQCDIPALIISPQRTTRCWNKQWTYKRSSLSTSSTDADEMIDLPSLRTPLSQDDLERIADLAAEPVHRQGRMKLRMKIVKLALERASEVFEEAQQAQPWYSLD